MTMTSIALDRSGLALHAMPSLAQPSVQVRGLHVAFGRQVVLDGLDWNLQPGQVVGLLGRNGAGKTTLLESLLGLREPQRGAVELFGQPLPQLTDAERARIGYVPQQSDLFEWLSPAQLLAYFRSFYPRWNEAKVQGLMSRWQIDPQLAIGKLSGGQKQRLSIIRALAHDPDLLVLDEPVASLDPAGRRDFLRELVEQVIDRGTTVVFSTHILSDLERVAFNMAFLSRGRIALQAPLDELLDTTRRLVGPAVDVEAWCARHPAAVLAKTQEGNLARALVRGASVPAAGDRVAIEAVTLEDLFLELTQ
jgi:ABC-2 type transport system ATP-binding protein